MSRGATARLFVALEPPAAVREALGEWAREVAAGMRAGADAALRARAGELRPLGVHTLHLTLCFLGSRPVTEIDALAAALAPCADHSFELALGAPLWLPPRHPRSLAVEVRDSSGELERMQRQLERALCDLSDWQPERRRFRAHITVARVRGRQARPRVRGAHRDGIGLPGADGEATLPATPPLSFTAETVTLYRSWLLPAGAAYEALASSALAPAAG